MNRARFFQLTHTNKIENKGQLTELLHDLADAIGTSAGYLSRGYVQPLIKMLEQDEEEEMALIKLKVRQRRGLRILDWSS